MTPETVTPAGSWLFEAAALRARKPPSVCLTALAQRSKWDVRDSRRRAISAAWVRSSWRRGGMGEECAGVGAGAEDMAVLRAWREASKVRIEEAKEERADWARSMVSLRAERVASMAFSSMKSSSDRGFSSAGRRAEATMVVRRVSIVFFRRSSASSRFLITFCSGQ